MRETPKENKGENKENGGIELWTKGFVLFEELELIFTIPLGIPT